MTGYLIVAILCSSVATVFIYLMSSLSVIVQISFIYCKIKIYVMTSRCIRTILKSTSSNMIANEFRAALV